MIKNEDDVFAPRPAPVVHEMGQLLDALSVEELGERIEALLASGRQFSARASFIRIGITTMALLALVAAGAQAPHWIALAQSRTTATPAPA